MTLPETLSLVLAAAALLVSLPSAVLALRQLRPATATATAPRSAVVAKMALFAYVAVMFALTAFYAFVDPKVETSLVYGGLAAVAVLLAQQLRQGHPGWWLAALAFSTLNILYVVMLGLGALIEEGMLIPTILLTVLLLTATVTATVALMAPAARAYLRRQAV